MELSLSFRRDHILPKIPTGTLTRKTYLQSNTESIPPNISPINDPPRAGIYMIPMTLGFLTMGPIGGALSDRYGARGIATIGMTIG